MKKEDITSDDILGKDAVDPEGAILGTVTKVHIDSKTFKVLGITIDMGLLKPDLFVGSKYIKNFGKDGVLLNKVPHEKYKGLHVITEGGKMIGKVKHIVVDNGKVQNLVVKSGKLGDGNYMINYKDIKHIGENIILKAEHVLKRKE